MIDLKAAAGNRVHLQFKRAILFVAAKDGRMGPLPAGPPRMMPNGQPDPTPPEPMVIDQIAGSLRFEESQPVLTYENPIMQGEFIDVYIDPENVAGAWVAKSVIAATASDIAHIR